MIDRYIQQYGKRLYGLCLTLCRNVHDADDLYQETWLHVLKSFSSYDPNLPFEPWLTRITVNLYRSTLRRIARVPFLRFADNAEKDAFFDSLPAPEQEDYLPLHEAIDRLPDRLRITVILYYFRNMDISAVAEALNIPPGTVKSRLNKARSLLKGLLDDTEDNP